MLAIFSTLRKLPDNLDLNNIKTSSFNSIFVSFFRNTSASSNDKAGKVFEYQSYF